MPKNTIKTINQEADKVELIATRNTFLPDGTFVKSGSRILVDAGYAKRVQEENNSAFTLINP